MGKKFIGKDCFGNDVYLAKTDFIALRQQELHKLLGLVAVEMGFGQDESDVRDWVDSCFVTDRSSVGDFCLGDDQVEKLGRVLGLVIQQSDLLYEIALRLKPPQ
jgi:hypothetical protein